MTRRRGKGQQLRKGNGAAAAPKPAEPKPPEPVEAEAAIVQKVRVQLFVAPEAHLIGPGQFLRLVPKPSKEPSVLVWIAETGMYQPVFIQPGKSWLLLEEDRVQALEKKVAEAEKPRIINPFA